MFDTLDPVHDQLAELTRDFEAGTLTGEQALRALERISAIRHFAEALFAMVAKRVDDTGVWARGAERQAIETAQRLEQLAEVDAAVREGRLSERQAGWISEAAEANPNRAQDLIDTAAQGFAKLKEACVRAIAATEDSATRAKRLHHTRKVRDGYASD